MSVPFGREDSSSETISYDVQACGRFESVLDTTGYEGRPTARSDLEPSRQKRKKDETRQRIFRERSGFYPHPDAVLKDDAAQCREHMM